MSSKASKKDIKALKALAAEMGYDLSAKGKKAKGFGKTKSGKTFREARLDRRVNTVFGGLTSVERKAIATTLPKGYSRKAWKKAVLAYKATH